MNHTPSSTPGAPDPGPLIPPPLNPDVEREEGPRKQKHNEKPEFAYEEDIPSDGEDPGCRPEISPIPAVPEMSPTADHRRN